MEELPPGEGMQVDGQSVDDTTQGVSEAKAEGNICQHNASLLSELQEDVFSSSVMVQLLSPVTVFSYFNTKCTEVN